ncbi:protein adenylyltransferase SelO [Pararobbsia silviterrae]|uniref:Protein nucleotidyltransferase YdiU n=1 Tax=Pararobbsia silviterrae TaxID=1792498 RepID=A0A494XYB9_9BURK|nr:YdiU family protein [Pararobbsia silviterrae]RKP54754.1 YdiU family protein [Pararobbsia silviterrae]
MSAQSAAPSSSGFDLGHDARKTAHAETAVSPSLDWAPHAAHGFASLGTAFSTRLPATPLPAPYLVGFSREAAALIGLGADAADRPDFVETMTGNRTRDLAPEALPLASVYSGHQFGVWAGQLGDGRALLLGERTGPDGIQEIQLKGAGLTPYSRMGDGRAVLRSSIREFLCSEAMHHLGIPTTRALCVTGSDAPVRRETIETAAVVTRLAPSFIRFGHFEHWFADDRPDRIRALADHVIDRHYPACRDTAQPYLAMLGEVVERTARMIAHWQSVGFCHGVMNTDNMSILGLTIDYGPYGFIDGFDANHVCNHSDAQGRYAYQAQPQVAYWNLFCLAQAMLPLFGEGQHAVEAAQQVLETYRTHFPRALDALLRAKLGLHAVRDDDNTLVNDLFKVMHENRADFTLTFRHLSRVSRDDASQDASVRDLFIDRAAIDRWLDAYRLRLRLETQDDAARAAAMDRVNPKFVLRNHLAETAIRHAREKDFSEVARLLDVLRHPFDEQPQYEAYAALPPSWASTLEVSCSS